MENTQNTPMSPTPIAASNPLAKYFRQPAIYTKLPSKGAFWPDGAVELPVTGDIPVYPMTARDEITLRTPDALMNGSSVVEVVHSCCPSIKNAWKMPSVDVDATLIAIRIASYGPEMDVDTICPHCKEENNHAIDLRLVLSNIKCPDYSSKLTTHNLKIKLKPQEFFGTNRQNTISYEEQRIMQSLSNVDLDNTVKADQIAKSMANLVEIGINSVVESTEYIELEDGTIVSQKEFIKEFYNNSDGAVMRDVQERIGQLNAEGSIAPLPVTCTSCAKSYEVPLEFDYANFFASGS